MRGEFIAVWPEMWTHVWEPLASHDDAPHDLFCELYRDLSAFLRTKPSIEQLAEIIDDPVHCREDFQTLPATAIAGERGIVQFLENAHSTLDDLAGDSLANRYFNLVEDFITRFSLRYDLRRPFQLCPTIQGIFASLIRELQALASTDQHLGRLMADFLEAVRDLRHGTDDCRIRVCIQRQMNLLEGMGRQCRGVTETTLGAISKEITSWPHRTLQLSLSQLYGFANDYPGIRHSGNPDGVMRDIDLRDLVAVSILLTGFTPYLTERLDAECLYRGA